MQLTTNQGAVWNISGCFIIFSSIAFLRKPYFSKIAFLQLANIFGVKTFSI